MTLVIKGQIDQNGYLHVEQKLDLPPGEVEIEIRESSPLRSLDAIKQRLEEIDEQGISDEQWEIAQQATEEMLAKAGETGLPEDFLDELDHYLYGTPKRSESD